MKLCVSQQRIADLPQRAPIGLRRGSDSPMLDLKGCVSAVQTLSPGAQTRIHRGQAQRQLMLLMQQEQQQQHHLQMMRRTQSLLASQQLPDPPLAHQVILGEYKARLHLLKSNGDTLPNCQQLSDPPQERHVTLSLGP